MISNQVLATFPFLCRLSTESRRLLDAGARVRQVSRGDLILRRGDRLPEALFVVSGQLRVFTLSAAGDQATLYLVGPGESCPLAINAMLADQPHQAWVAVESATARMLQIPTAVYRNLHDNEPAVREFTLEILSRRISSLMTALESLTLLPMGERVLAHLRERAGPGGEVKTTHAEIALSLGTAREVVSRQISALRVARKIRTSRARILLL